MGKLVEITLTNGKKVLFNKDKVELLSPEGDTTKIFLGSGEFDYIHSSEDIKKISKKIDGEIRVSFIDIAIFVLLLIFIFLKLIQ
nr:MAG TPA: Flagellar and Swarming motility protein [Caudoviricetes sp.]